MPSMLLSSLRRVRLYVGAGAEDPIADALKNNRTLLNWLSSISGKIEKYCGREMLIKSRTQYFDIMYAKNLYYPDAYPILDLGSVYQDSSVQWDGGSEGELTDSVSNSEATGVIVPHGFEYKAQKALRIEYTGGLAYHPVNSVFILSATGAYTVDNWIRGSTSEAIGRVVSISGTTLTVQNYYGIFQKGETVIEYATEYDPESVPTATVTAKTINSISKQSLAEAEPELVSAVENEIRYMWKHQTDFENIGTTKEGATIRKQQPMKRRWPLQEETLDMLEPYVRKHGY